MDAGYQRMDTAPRDGEAILANGPMGPHVVFWGVVSFETDENGRFMRINTNRPDDLSGRWIVYSDPRKFYPAPTMWMPIPPTDTCTCPLS